MENKFVEVILPLPVEKTFSYAVPADLKTPLKKGMRVRVPFCSRRMTGFVYKIEKRSPVAKVKTIIEVIDTMPVIDEAMFKLAEKISHFYLSSLGETLKAFLPYGLAAYVQESVCSVEYSLSDKAEVPADIEELFLKLGKELSDKIKEGVFSVNVIHGFSAAERRFLYLELIDNILKKGGSVLLLVPDFSFIPPLEEFFRRQFGEDKVFSFHAHLRNKERSLRWFRVKEKAVLVIGTQQAVFLPFIKLSLVVVEEEQEILYKQKNSPRYNAKDAALLRAEIEKIPAVLASTAPSLETYYYFQKNKNAHYFNFVSYQKKPAVEIVDLNRQNISPYLLSKTAEVKIFKCLEENKKVFLLLNRKGHSTYLHCPKCAYLKKCPDCDLPLVYYYSKAKVVCRFCSYEENLPKLCPKCQGAYLDFGGIGIEKLAGHLCRIFPQAKVSSLSSHEKENCFNRIISDFNGGSIDILIATQILAKRYHGIKADLAVLVLAEQAFNLPDFRVSERFFALVEQIKNLIKPGGEFVLQTFTPDIPALRYAAQDNLKFFYEEELKIRRELFLPPFTDFIQIVISSENKKSSQKTASDLEDFLRQKVLESNIQKLKISENAPCFYSKIKKRYRWQLNVFSGDKNRLLKLAQEIKINFKKPAGVRITFDPFAQQLL